MSLNKILCFTLPISWVLYFIFQNSEISFIICPILGANIGLSICYLWGYNDLKYDTNLMHLDSDTILCLFKKCEKDS